MAACHVARPSLLLLRCPMPEQAGQQAPQAAGIGVWLNRVFLGFTIYVLIFGNPLKSFLPDVANVTAPVQVNGDVPASAPTTLTPTSISGKHHPMIVSGTKLVRVYSQGFFCQSFAPLPFAFSLLFPKDAVLRYV